MPCICSLWIKCSDRGNGITPSDKGKEIAVEENHVVLAWFVFGIKLACFQICEIIPSSFRVQLES